MKLLNLLSFSTILMTSVGFSQSNTPIYLDANLTYEVRLDDLMSRMTLEEKVYQMNQFVGLDHMRQAEKNLTEEELHSNDAQGFYKGLFSDDVAQMTKEGKIGSFLHVLTTEEANPVSYTHLTLPTMVQV